MWLCLMVWLYIEKTSHRRNRQQLHGMETTLRIEGGFWKSDSPLVTKNTAAMEILREAPQEREDVRFTVHIALSQATTKL